jgi:hypothetical protein
MEEMPGFAEALVPVGWVPGPGKNKPYRGEKKMADFFCKL